MSDSSEEPLVQNNAVNTQVKRNISFIDIIAALFAFFAGFQILGFLLFSILTITVKSTPLLSTMIVQFSKIMPNDSFNKFFQFDYWIIGITILSIVAFISCLGLLKRIKWARFLFIGVLVANILVMVKYIIFYNKFPDIIPYATPLNILSCFFCIVFVIFYIWLIRKFISSDVKQAFSPS